MAGAVDAVATELREQAELASAVAVVTRETIEKYRRGEIRESDA